MQLTEMMQRDSVSYKEYNMTPVTQPIRKNLGHHGFEPWVSLSDSWSEYPDIHTRFLFPKFDSEILGVWVLSMPIGPI